MSKPYKPSVLILHHFEPMWDQALRQTVGLTFAEMQRRAINHIRYAEYDRVIVTRFEDWTLDHEAYDPRFTVLVNETHDYGYGWGEEEHKNDPKMFCPGGGHSGSVYLPDWIRRLKGCRVYVGGFFDGECLTDLITALKHFKIGKRRIEHLIA